MGARTEPPMRCWWQSRMEICECIEQVVLLVYKRMTVDNFGRTRTSPLWNTLKLILAIGLSVFVLSRTNLSELVETLRSASIPWLVVSTLLFVLVTLLKTLQYFVLMRNKLSFSQVLNLIIWQNTISNYFLTSAGIVAYITMTRMDHEIKVSRSVTTFLLTKAGDLTAVWFVLLVSTGLLWHRMGVLQMPALFLILVIGIVVLTFFLAVFLRQSFVNSVKMLADRTGMSRFGLVSRVLMLLQDIADMDQGRVLSVLGKLILCSFAYLAVTLAWSYANLAVFNLFMQPMPFIFVFALIQLISYIPIAVFGGLGITESSALYFWNHFDVPPDVLAPAMIGVRFVFYLVNLIPLIYLPLYAVSHGSKNNQTNE